MNILLFDSSELQKDDSLKFGGRRAEYLADIQGVGPGEVIRVGEINGKMGYAEVHSVSNSEVQLKVQSLETESAASQVDLIVALPRPQMLKRILQTAATMGVRRLELIRSERVIKSYFSSPVLQEECIRENLLLGLEQGVSTHLPQVRVHPRFRPFVEDEVPVLLKDAPLALLAHTSAREDISELNMVERVQRDTAVLLAIGPEGGWQAHEVAAFEAAGFELCGLGQRVMRVETAVVSLLAQIDLLRKLT